MKSLLKAKIAAFQGTRGKWKGKPIELKVKEGLVPFYTKPYKIPKAYEGTTKTEVKRLEKIGLVRKTKTALWAAPCFVIPKKRWLSLIFD